MCLTIKNGTTRRTAKHDIHVYKCLDKTKDGKYITPFQYYPIVFGAQGICLLESELIKEFSVYVGIHGFVDPAIALKCELDFRDEDGTLVHHAIIPKGAKYYLGDAGDIAADKMLIFKTTSLYLEYTSLNKVIEI